MTKEFCGKSNSYVCEEHSSYTFSDVEVLGKPLLPLLEENVIINDIWDFPKCKMIKTNKQKHLEPHLPDIEVLHIFIISLTSITIDCIRNEILKASFGLKLKRHNLSRNL